MKASDVNISISYILCNKKVSFLGKKGVQAMLTESKLLQILFVYSEIRFLVFVVSRFRIDHQSKWRSVISRKVLTLLLFFLVILTSLTNNINTIQSFIIHPLC